MTTWTTFVGRPDVDASAARACEHVMMQNVRQAAPGRRAHAPAEAPRAPRVTAVAGERIPLDAIAFTGRVKSVDRERRTATVALAAHSAGKKIFGRATATIGLGD